MHTPLQPQGRHAVASTYNFKAQLVFLETFSTPIPKKVAFHLETCMLTCQTVERQTFTSRIRGSSRMGGTASESGASAASAGMGGRRGSNMSQRSGSSRGDSTAGGRRKSLMSGMGMGGGEGAHEEYELSGKTGLTKPYCVMFADFADGIYKTGVMHQDENTGLPSTTECPVIQPSTHSRGFLERQFLLFSVKHEGALGGGASASPGTSPKARQGSVSSGSEVGPSAVTGMLGSMRSAAGASVKSARAAGKMLSSAVSASEVSKGDYYASAVLPLSDVIVSEDGRASFCIPLYYAGSLAGGTLTGIMKMTTAEAAGVQGIPDVVSSSEIVVETIYECQRKPLTKSFGADHLLAKDPPAFCDDTFKKATPKEQFVLRSGWIWQDDWKVHNSGGDAEGWTYAEKFRSEEWFDKKKMAHKVRRRLWVRTRVVATSSSVTV